MFLTTAELRRRSLLSSFVHALTANHVHNINFAYVQYFYQIVLDNKRDQWPPMHYDTAQVNQLPIDSVAYDICLREVMNTQIFCRGINFKATVKTVWDTHKSHLFTYAFLPFYSPFFHRHSKTAFDKSTPRYVFTKTQLRYHFNVVYNDLPTLSTEVIYRAVYAGLTKEISGELSVLVDSLFPPDCLSPVRFETDDLPETTTCPLTKRQLEILKYTSAGHKSKDIADLLNISVNTVSNHKSDIRERVQLNTTETINKAKKEGWFK